MCQQEMWCKGCDDETMHEISHKHQRWSDESIDDDDLTQLEYIERANGDSVTTYTCLACFASFDDM